MGWDRVRKVQSYYFLCLYIYIIMYLQGLYGALFIKCNLLWTKLRKRRFSKFPLPLIEVH